jgi:hypothetical protein
MVVQAGPRVVGMLSYISTYIETFSKVSGAHENQQSKLFNQNGWYTWTLKKYRYRILQMEEDDLRTQG